MASGWRWANVPIPEAHLILIVVSATLDVLWPLSISPDRGWVMGIGALLILGSVAVMVWATLAAGRVRLAEPDRIVTTGPYRVSRHPMYVAWTSLYLGLAGILSSGWLLILLPVLAIWVHWEATREEKRLVEAFGSAYEEYRSQVRRYL